MNGIAMGLITSVTEGLRKRNPEIPLLFINK